MGSVMRVVLRHMYHTSVVAPLSGPPRCLQPQQLLFEVQMRRDDTRYQV